MGLFDSTVSILVITILLAEVEKSSNSEESSNKFASIRGSHNLSESLCTELISRAIPQYVPYTETYRARSWGLYRPLTRTNYKIEHHILKIVEPKCCEGYMQVGRMCMPHCSRPCHRGICVKPNVCQCNAGYQMHINVNGNELCEPLCTNGCVNGTCIDVELCSCKDGYWLDADGITCRPVCEIECELNRGYCAEPNVCSCLPGYVRAEINEDIKDVPHFTCKPVCDRPCTNGRCITPNLCSCEDGYTPDKSDPRFTCKPKCDDGCVFGRCTAPGICTCDEGYQAVNASVCKPICSERCIMGTCVAPEICKCMTGYRYLGNFKYTCEPICETGTCVNGRCIAPGLCICDDGYAMQTSSFCEPVCEGGCQNGDCVSPNRCVCHENFVPSTRLNFSTECVPACTRNCSGHGVCMIDEANHVCQCYFGWTGEDCDQPTMCVVMMDVIRNDISKLMVHNETNSTVMRAHKNAPYCYQCDNYLVDIESLCYTVQSDEANTTSAIGCLLSTDLPCYAASHPSTNTVNLVWPLVSIAVLILTSLIAATYLVYRRHQRKKLITAHTSSRFAQEAFAAQSLLSENVIYL